MFVPCSQLDRVEFGVMTNAILVPSGDQAGVVSQAAAVLVRLLSPLPSALTTWISALVGRDLSGPT